MEGTENCKRKKLDGAQVDGSTKEKGRVQRLKQFLAAP